MALQITKETQYGIDATYWNIKSFEKLSFKDKEVAVQLAGYKDKTQRAIGQPLTHWWFHINGDNFDFDYTDNITEKTYLKIKADENWIGAKDI